jgi:ribosomal-protein-alanine N-acetyltransferase
MQIAELKTDRLLLRQWVEQDLPVFALLNSDPEVMAYFPALLSREESDEVARKCKSLISERGWGFWAVELKSSGDFIGFVGLHIPKLNLPFSPCVEIGWRLRKTCWGNGYATEAAAEALNYAFDILKLDEVVSFTVISNFRSRSVMERLGFSNTHQNFEHPDIQKGHPLSEHALYKITRDEWQRAVF